MLRPCRSVEQIAGCCREYVPAIGNIIGIIPPVLYGVIQFEGWTMPLIVFAEFAALQITISNVIFPMLQGSRMATPPVAIIIALLFWGWMWGVAALQEH